MKDEEASTGGVAALDGAIAILKAFTVADRPLSLAEISARTGLYKSTILRSVASLIRAHLLSGWKTDATGSGQPCSPLARHTSARWCRPIFFCRSCVSFRT